MAAVEVVGAPEITPVVEFMLRPAGKVRLTDQLVDAPPVLVGVKGVIVVTGELTR